MRRDLLAHLNTLVVRVPPLREYAEDVPELLRYYVDRAVDTEGLPFRRFSVAAQNRLRNYPWPDNVRELKNLVHRLLHPGRLGGDPARGDRARARQSRSRAGEPLVKQDLLALPLREAREQFERAYLRSSCCCATARWASSPSASAWSARTSTASCARSASTSAT